MSKDTVTKKYFSDNDRFADVFNYFLYDGKQTISPKTLLEQDTTELLAYLSDDGEIVKAQKYRDLLKKCIIKNDGQDIYVLLGIENQRDVHYAMPLRNNIYDVLNYAKQVEKIAKQHKEDKDIKGAEFLSGFAKDDKIIPVITLVVYWSPDEWDGPRCLYDMFDVGEKEILKYVNDYKMNIIIPREMEDTHKFSTDFRHVMDFMKVSKDKEKMKLLMKEERDVFSQMPVDTAMVINECANVEINIDEKEEKINMCKAWEDMAQEVREETEARMCKAWEDMAQEVREETEARMCKAWEDMAQEVREETEINIIYKLYNKGSISLEDALEETGLREEDFLAKLK